MKNRLIKVLSLILVTALLCGGTAVMAYTAGVKNNGGTKVTKEAAENAASENKTETTKDSGKSDISKDETVYVIAGSDGSVQKIIVSDWIKNAIGSDSITDDTSLDNITNVKGDESYKMDSDKARVWDAGGNDIYYQGDIKKELPVDISVSYKLDGKSISASELAGKNGKVTIRFDYKNNQSETVKIDGKNETIYVPFVMLTGIMLDNDTFSNVEVSNGKLINDGDRSVVIGLALPGLQKNLALDSDMFEIPDYLEINADVKDFKLSSTLTLASNEVFSGLDLGDKISFDDLSGSMTGLSDAMTRLLDGSSALYNGISTLLEKSDELISGVDKLVSGAKQLSQGAGSLESGADELLSGMKTLSGGLETLTSNNDKLNSGAKTVFETLLYTVQTQVKAAGLDIPELTIENYSEVLNEAINSLSEDKIRALATEKAKNTVTTAVTSAVRANVLSGVLKAKGITAEVYNNLPEANKSAINAAVDAQMSSETVKTQISALVEQNMSSDNVKSQIASAVETAKAGAASLSAAKAQLDSYNEFYIGLLSYTAGVNSAYSGSEQLLSGSGKLAEGAGSLSDGADSLYSGLKTLKNGSSALTDGISKLNQGAMQLSDGLKKFNEQGIQKLINTFNGNINGLITRIKATVDVSKDYKSFAGISNNMDGNVKFIYKTGSID